MNIHKGDNHYHRKGVSWMVLDTHYFHTFTNLGWHWFCSCRWFGRLPVSNEVSHAREQLNSSLLLSTQEWETFLVFSFRHYFFSHAFLHPARGEWIILFSILSPQFGYISYVLISLNFNYFFGDLILWKILNCLKVKDIEQVLVALACNPSFLGGWDKEELF
jgi:hypothetical protein